MKCENCDFKCNESINYCPKLGILMNNNNKDITLHKFENIVCEKCNTDQISTSIYCNECGNLLYNISSSHEKISSNYGYKKYLKEKIFISITSIILLGIVSLFIKGFIGIIDKNTLDYISISNIILGLNLAPIEVISSKFIELNKFNLNIGLIIYLIVPILCLSISINIFKRSKNYLKDINVIKDSITIGLIYGMILGVISIFASYIVDKNIDMFYTVKIIIRYKTTGVIINGFIIGTIISYINLVKYSDNKLIKLGIKAFATITIMYLIILCILIISIYSGNVLGYRKDLISIISISQIAIYLLGISTFIPIVILRDIISIINLNQISNYLNENILLLIYGSILINMMIIFISGYLMKYEFKTSKCIKIYSIYYAMFISGIIHISKIERFIGMDIVNLSNYNHYISIGGNIVISVIVGYIYCYIISLLGYKTNRL